MKKTKIFAAIGGLSIVALSVFLIAADHIDSPTVDGTKVDIADLYAFEGDNPNSTVFIATPAKCALKLYLLSPCTVTQGIEHRRAPLYYTNVITTGNKS